MKEKILWRGKKIPNYWLSLYLPLHSSQLYRRVSAAGLVHAAVFPLPPLTSSSSQSLRFQSFGRVVSHQKKKNKKKSRQHSPHESTQGFISPLPNNSIFQRAPVPRILVKASFSHTVYSVVLFLSVEKKKKREVCYERRDVF